MNSSANGYNAPGVGVNALEQSNGGSATLLLQIEEALKLIHDPRCTNDARHQASTFLEDIKADDQAPSHGFTLACDRRQNPFVRHYALSLLEYATKHKWAGYSDEQANTLRQWVLQLAQNIAEDDPSYLRNKTAQLWVEIAKRTWAAEWMDMDELLVRLWDIPGAVVYKEFVLFVLETLSDDVFNGDDTVAALREGTLSKACVEIFTPAIVLVETFPNRERGVPVRYGEEGWLVRMGELLNQCLGSDLAPNTHYESCAARILAVYKSVMPWVVPRAVASASSVQHMCKSLASPSVRVQLAAVESLHALYCRLHFSEEEFVALICPMYTSQSIELLRKLFEWSIVMDPNDIDDQKYLFAKKFSEMMSNLGGLLESRTSSLPPDCDVPNLLRLFLVISQSQSFVISIPILVTWTRLLRSVVIAPAIEPLIVPLLELCTSRLIRYENLPEDIDDASLQFLIQDLDSIPERHAFLGNYRRYCSHIIELVVRQKHKSAIEHILSKVNHSMLQIYDGHRHFSVEGYSKHSMPVLRLDAQCTVIEAALKGYMKWLSLHGSAPQQDEQARTDIENHLEEWCSQLLSMDFKDPIIQKRVLQLTVAFATTALDKKVTYIHKVLDHILKVVPDEQPGHGAYTEAVKELQTDGMHELQRLALKMPDELLDIYEPLQESVYRIINSGTQDRKRVVSFQTFLFTIIHRTTKLNQDIKIAKLSESVIPIQNMWLDADMTEDLKSFNGFCRLLGLDRVKDYFVSRPTLNRIQDWGSHQLDDEGQAIQRELDDRLKAQPLRTTKSVLGCSLEKIEKDTAAFEVSKLLWGNALQDILPNLLKFLSHAHAFHNPENWSGLPTEMRPLVRRILMDRFWQAGISEGSKDDFYNRVTSTKSTMEGFASSIRGSIRTVREASYAILWCMSRLDTQFYGIDGLPGPLANALFADAHSLSTHQFIALLNVVRSMVDDCPVEFRAHFIPPLLAACFQSVDAKCTKEWEQQSKKQGGYTDGDSLTEEMKEESILRQLTHAAVMMIGGFLDPARLNLGLSYNTGKEASTYLPEKGSVGSVATYPSLRKFCLTNANILEPLLLFMTHAIRMRDTRCCGVVLRVFRSIVPEFLSKEDGEDSLSSRIRYYISTQVLEACVTSLYEPYFVDVQKDIAQLIATILIYYSSLTSAPRDSLLQLKGIGEQAVDKCIDYMSRPGQQARQQRALVLDLLREYKGVSISEQGRITKSVRTVRKEVSKMQQEFVKEQAEPELDGIAKLFGS